MPRVDLSDVNHYSGGGNFKRTKYLTLTNDGDTVSVHFLLDNEDDLNECIYVTHNVKLKSVPKLKYGVRVNCLRKYSDPIDDCPFCREGYQTQISCVIPVYNVDADEVQFWVRGKKEAQRLLRKMSKVKGKFSQYVWEITRIGEPGDQATDYDYGIPERDDEFDMSELDIPEVLGGPVLDKSVDDMEYYLDENDFPPEGSDDEDEEPVRRRPSKLDKKAKSRREEPEDEEDLPFEEDEEDLPRRRPTGGRKVRRRTPDEEF